MSEIRIPTNDPNPTEAPVGNGQTTTSLQLQVTVLWGIVVVISSTILLMCAGAFAGKIDSNEKKNHEQDSRFSDHDDRINNLDIRLQKLEPKKAP